MGQSIDKKKVVVVGIDGGEISVLKRMIDKGLMPNLDSIAKKGHVRDIDTYVKGYGQGWASFMTGKSPEKHGVFYWNLYTRLVTSETLKEKLLWEILGEKGIKSCVINMSYTYPPKPLNGYMISGMGSGLSASKNMKVTYPEDLMDEIKRGIGDYIVAREYKEGSVDDHVKLIKDLIRMTEYRAKACLYIMGKYSPEFVLIVFRGADLIQHCFWNLLEPAFKISETTKPLQEAIESYYQELDRGIGRIFSKYGDSINMIVSDHGFGPVKAIVYLNNHLEQCGFLVKQKEFSGSGEVNIIGVSRNVLKYIYRKFLKNIEVFKKLNKFRTKIIGIDLPIDKNKTIAYSNTLFGVSINKQSPIQQSLEETKNNIIKCLQELKDPATDEKVITKVYIKKDSYAKDFEDAPEIMFEANEKYFVTYEMPLNNKDIFKYMNKEERAFFTGSHRQSGIFIVDGSDLEVSEKKKDSNITDAFATILNLFNIKVPDDVDGRAICKTRVH